MIKQNFQLPENMSPQSRNAFFIAIAIASAHFIAVLYYLYLLFTGQVAAVTPFLMLIAVSVALGVIFLVSSSLSWRGRPVQGTILMLGILALSYPPIALLVTGLGAVLGIALMFVGPMSAHQVLPRRPAWIMTILTVLSGLATFLIDVFGSTARPLLPGAFIQLLAVSVVGVVGFFIVQQFRVHSMQITRKLLVPTLTFIGLIIAGLITYNTAISVQQFDEAERRSLENMSEVFQARLKAKEDLAVALASEVANNPEVQAAFAARDRERLIELTLPSYQVIDAQFDIPQYQFHLAPATSFLRLHSLDNYGDDLSSFRFTVLAANAEKRVISGLEIGRGGLGVRGVVPVTYQGRHIGTVEFGPNADLSMIEELKSEFGYDWQILLSRGPAETATFEGAIGESQGPINELLFQASTLSAPIFASATYYQQALAGNTGIENVSVGDLEYAIFSSPLHDYSGNIIGVVNIISDRTAIAQQQNTQVLLSIGILLAALLVVGFGFSFIAGRTLRPISELTSAASTITAGDLYKRADVRSDDEIGTLAVAFNTMTSQLQETLEGLEQRVAERTQNLELAAEVGRTVSQVGDLKPMLAQAAALILERFDLYYVQVYLADPDRATLILEAGTGAVGAQLLERGHRLQLNTGSINGRAAVERRPVVISDTTGSLTFRPNPLLPETRGEMALPLIVGEKVVGVLDLQARDPGVLTEELLPAFEALAGQLAVAIQNATLLEEAQQARAEVEAQARRLVRKNWDEHLDAIHKPEQLGFVFDHDQVTPLQETDEFPDESRTVSAPISLTGEMLGSLVVEVGEENKNEQAGELVNIVARQVAQQIENLRLLESAERYRFEAEQAARRHMRDGWQEYINAKAGESLGYLYDLKEVRPHSNGHETDESALTLPLKVRDEAVGKLSIQGLTPDDNESFELASAVAERLSAHIESLRQYGQTQSALAQSEKLFEASRSLTQAADLQELVAAAVTTLGIPEVNRALLTTFNYDSEGEIDQLTITGNWWNGEGHEVTPIGTRYPLEVIRVMPMFVSPTPVFFSDTFHDERVDATTMELVKKLNLRAVAVLPLHLGSHQLGALILEAEDPHNFTPEETRLFTSLAPQIATVLDNRQQYERAQRQAEREAMLNAISQKIQGATSVDAVLQIAARELGHALGAPMTIAQLSMKDQN